MRSWVSAIDTTMFLVITTDVVDVKTAASAVILPSDFYVSFRQNDEAQIGQNVEKFIFYNLFFSFTTFFP